MGIEGDRCGTAICVSESSPEKNREDESEKGMWSEILSRSNFYEYPRLHMANSSITTNPGKKMHLIYFNALSLASSFIFRNTSFIYVSFCRSWGIVQMNFWKYVLYCSGCMTWAWNTPRLRWFIGNNKENLNCLRIQRMTKCENIEEGGLEHRIVTLVAQ